MHQWLGEHPVPTEFPVGDEQRVVATVDVFESVLANLRQRRIRGTAEDPFRHGVDAVTRQDVTVWSAPVPARHPKSAAPALRA